MSDKNALKFCVVNDLPPLELVYIGIIATKE